MRRPMNIGIMGGPKVGKTHLAGTAFASKHVEANRVLYLDNHGSTDTFDFPQYTDKTRWGVKHISPADPEELSNFLLELRRKFLKGQYPYDLTVVDDWSEFAQGDIDDRLDDEDETKVIRHWGKHGSVMRDAGQIVHPDVSHAHHIAIFRASQMPDPLEARPRKKGGGFVSDTRETMIRPFLQGSFAAWFPYKLDAVWYQYMEVEKDKYRFYLQWVPNPKVAVLSRWLHHWVENPRMPRKLVNPTFDAIWEMVNRFETGDMSKIEEEIVDEQGES